MKQSLTSVSFLSKSLILSVLLIAPHALANPPAEAARPKPTLGGDYSALAVTLFVDKNLVQSWLPDGLILDKECPYENTHPVIILSGVQRNFALKTYVKLYPWWGRKYREVFISIPHLKLKEVPDKPSVHHFVRVYLDQWTATDLGVKRGWPKRMVKIEREANVYRVFGIDESVIFESNVDFTKALPLDNNNASFAEIRDMLSMPMVLQKPTGGFNVFDFDFHFESARIYAVPVSLQVHENYLPGLKSTVKNVDGINTTDFGAFYLKTRFTNQAMSY